MNKNEDRYEKLMVGSECYDSDMQPRKPVIKKISPHSAISAILTWAEEGMRTRMWSLLTALASEVTLSMIFIMLC